MISFADMYVCDDCGEEFRDDGTMICPNCGGGDLIEACEYYEEEETEDYYGHGV